MAKTLRQLHQREYKTWSSMRYRCYSKANLAFKHYGGRGIKVCERWRFSFENFLADMGPRPDGCSIDRIDNNGNYEPGNCRWATNKQQARNTRTNVLYSMRGERKTKGEWEELGLTFTPIKLSDDQYELIESACKKTGTDIGEFLTTSSIEYAKNAIYEFNNPSEHKVLSRELDYLIYHMQKKGCEYFQRTYTVEQIKAIIKMIQGENK